MFKLLNNLKQSKLTNIKSIYINVNPERSFSVLKIDDLSKKRNEKSEDEKLRCKLAACYRLVGTKGWDMSIFNHITIRSKENPEHFLINPFGLLYQEMTASGMVKIDSDCTEIEAGSTSFGVNFAGFTLHSAIHDARSDINAVIHVHTSEAAGISALKSGMLLISQEAFICAAAGIGYHDYEGVLIDQDMRQVISKDLDQNRILILRNHGAAFCGKTIEEAFFWLYTFMTAVKIQHVAQSAASGQDNLHYPPKRILDQLKMIFEAGGVSQNSNDGIEWGVGEMEYEAEMRNLDYKGYQTGYDYKKQPSFLKNE